MTIAAQAGLFSDVVPFAPRRFVKQEPREKRRLLNFMLSDLHLGDGQVVPVFRQSFDLLAESP